nr:MAG TPA: hypothetical protein [Inoviridae sp.]
MEIVCRSEAYRRFKSSSLRHRNNGLRRICRDPFVILISLLEHL